MFIFLKYILSFSLIAFFLSSCSTLSKDECNAADWKTIGYADGARGYQASRIDRHRSACAEYSIRPNLDEYSQGRNSGLVQYCTPNTAYRLGISGYRYNGVCAAHNEEKFVEAFHQGLNIYQAKNKLKDLKSQYTEEDFHIVKLEKKLYKKENRLVSGKLPRAKAIEVLNRTKEITQEIEEAKSQQFDLNNIINRQSQHIQYLENKPYQ